MGNFWKSTKFNTVILSCTLGVFAFGSLMPLKATPYQMDINFNDIAFGFRIEKLVEKVNRYRERRDSKKLIEVMFDIKQEIEGYTGRQIRLSDTLDQVEREVKSRGGKVDPKVMKKIKKDLKKKEKRAKHKFQYMAKCLELNLPFNAEEEALLYKAAYPIDEVYRGKHKDKDDEVNIPLRVTIGVTVTLCGVFLLFVPIPICKQYAPYVIETGVAFLVDEGITQWEEKDKDEKNRKSCL